MHRGVRSWEERRKWQNPEEILSRAGVRAGSTFLDIGCGDGFFAIPAARMVGEGGKVCGLDIDADAIDELRERAAQEGLGATIHLRVGPAEEIVLCDHCADTLFFGIDLHDFQDQRRVLRNARKMLKPAGRLVNLDWKKEEMPIGPPYHIRFSEEEAARLLEEAGFRVEILEPSGQYHYLMIARP